MVGGKLLQHVEVQCFSIISLFLVMFFGYKSMSIPSLFQLLNPTECFAKVVFEHD